MIHSSGNGSAVWEGAKAYLSAGLSIIPILPDGSKSPAWSYLPQVWNERESRYKYSWRVYQERLPTLDEISFWFTPCVHPPLGLAVLGGGISGGLEVIDLDNMQLAEQWVFLVERAAAGLLDRVVLVETPRPGLHVYFRSPAWSGNLKLVRTPVMDPETGQLKKKALIEVKGEGGYCLAPPSPPECHPTGRLYSCLYNRDLTMIPTITAEERAVMFTAARSLDCSVDSSPRASLRGLPSRGNYRQSSGDKLIARVSWQSILEPHGWRLVGCDAGGVDKWRRPGKSVGHSATVNYAGNNLLHVFSESADPFEGGRSYSKFVAYALLNYHGDCRRAITWLRDQGYGRRRRQPLG